MQVRPIVKYNDMNTSIMLPATAVHSITAAYTYASNELLNRFNVYGYQQVPYGTEKHKVTSFQAIPYGIVAGGSCGWQPKRLGQTFNSEITLKPFELNGEECKAEFMGAGNKFMSLLDPTQRTFNADGLRLLGAFARQVNANFSDDIIAQGTSASLISSFSGVTFDPKLDDVFFTNLQAANSLYTGWLKQLVTQAGVAGFEHCNLELLASGDLTNEAKNIDPVKAMEALNDIYDNAPAQLKQMANSVRVDMNGQPINAVFIVSYSYYEAAKAFRWKKENTTGDFNSVITVEPAGNQELVRFRGIPLIYDSRLEHYHQFLSNTHAHIAVLTTSQNINYIMGIDGTLNQETGEIENALRISIPNNFGEYWGKKAYMFAAASAGAGVANIDLVSASIQSFIYTP